MCSTDHVIPSQCSMTNPVVHTSVGETARIPPSDPSTLADGSIDHEAPSQCSISVVGCPVASSRCPAAQTSSGVSAETAFRYKFPLLGSGVRTTLHEEPSQCSANARYLPSEAR